MAPVAWVVVDSAGEEFVAQVAWAAVDSAPVECVEGVVPVCKAAAFVAGSVVDDVEVWP